jgi:hypothetical protein
MQAPILNHRATLLGLLLPTMVMPSYYSPQAPIHSNLS